MKRKTVKLVKKNAPVLLVAVLLLIIFFSASTSPLVLRQSVYDERVGFINIEVHQLNFVQEFLKQFMSYVDFSKHTYRPGELVEGSAIIDANTGGKLFGKIELLGWYQTRLQDYCNAYPATPENCGRPSDSSCPYGSCTWLISWSHNAPTVEGEYFSRLYIYDNDHHLVESTPMSSFYVEPAPSECPSLSPPTDWTKSEDVYFGGKDVGDIYFRTVFESKPYPECSSSHIEYKTVCDEGYYIEGTVNSRSAGGKQNCLLSDDFEIGLTDNTDVGPESQLTALGGSKPARLSDLVIENLYVYPSRVSLERSVELHTGDVGLKVFPTAVGSDVPMQFDADKLQAVAVRLGIANKGEASQDFNFGVSIWPAEKWEEFRKNNLQSLYSNVDKFYEFAETCGMRQPDCKNNPECEAFWTVEGRVEGLTGGDSIYFPRVELAPGVPGVTKSMERAGWYALYIPPPEGVFADGSSAFSVSGDYYVVAYLYDHCAFEDPNAKTWGFTAAKFHVDYPSKDILAYLSQKNTSSLLIPGTETLKPAFSLEYLSLIPKLEKHLVWSKDKDDDWLLGVTGGELYHALQREVSYVSSPVCTVDEQCITDNCVFPVKEADLFGGTVGKLVYQTFYSLADRITGSNKAVRIGDVGFGDKADAFGVGLCVEKSDPLKEFLSSVSDFLGVSYQIAKLVVFAGTVLAALLLFKPKNYSRGGM